MTEVISSNTRSSSKKEIQRLEKKLSESEKANSILKIENMELKEKLDLVTSELREIQLKQGNSIYRISSNSFRP